VIDVVSPHFVEGILRLEDIVDQIKDDESIVDVLDDIRILVFEAVVVFLNEIDALEVDHVFFEVLAVEGDDVLLYEFATSVLEGDLEFTFRHFLLLNVFLNYVFIHFLQHKFDEMMVMRLLDDAMRCHECLDADNFIPTPDAFEEYLDELFLLGYLFVELIVDADIDFLGVDIGKVDVDVYVIILPLVVIEILLGQVNNPLGVAHLMALVDSTLVKHFLDLRGRGKQTFEHWSP
jgi:hypothetical protein